MPNPTHPKCAVLFVNRPLYCDLCTLSPVYDDVRQVPKRKVDGNEVIIHQWLSGVGTAALTLVWPGCHLTKTADEINYGNIASQRQATEAKCDSLAFLFHPNLSLELESISAPVGEQLHQAEIL